MKLGDRLEEVLAEGEAGDVARERYAFGYSPWYLALKVLLSVAAGSFILYTAVSPGTAGSALARLIAVGVALWFFVLALGVVRGLRQITVDDSSVQAMYGTGRRVSWARDKLSLPKSEREMKWSGSVTVRLNPEGGVAFRLPLDFPKWRRIIDLIAGDHAPA